MVRKQRAAGSPCAGSKVSHVPCVLVAATLSSSASSVKPPRIAGAAGRPSSTPRIPSKSQGHHRQAPVC